MVKVDQKSYQKKWYQKNKTRVIARVVAWRKANPERAKEINRKSLKKYDQTPKGIYNNLCKNSRKRRREIKVSQTDFLQWHDLQEKKCFYCKIPEKVIKNIPF